jgi:hypothetical protein
MPGGLSFEYPRHDDHDQYDDYNYNKDSRIDTSAEDIAYQLTTGHRKKQEEKGKESDKVFHSVIVLLLQQKITPIILTGKRPQRSTPS